MSRIGIDIDGVLANFVSSYKDYIVRVTGRDLFPSGDIWDSWNHETAVGYTSADISLVWDCIRADPCFWKSLSPYPETRAALFAVSDQIATGSDVYFITARPGVAAKAQTEDWLHQHWPTFHVPRLTVLLSSHKGLCARALNLDAYIDDRIENVIDVAATSMFDDPPQCRTFLLSRPWNASLKTATHFVQGIHRITTLPEMFN